MQGPSRELNIMIMEADGSVKQVECVNPQHVSAALGLPESPDKAWARKARALMQSHRMTSDKYRHAPDDQCSPACPVRLHGREYLRQYDKTAVDVCSFPRILNRLSDSMHLQSTMYKLQDLLGTPCNSADDLHADENLQRIKDKIKLKKKPKVVEKDKSAQRVAAKKSPDTESDVSHSNKLKKKRSSKKKRHHHKKQGSSKSVHGHNLYYPEQTAYITGYEQPRVRGEDTFGMPVEYPQHTADVIQSPSNETGQVVEERAQHESLQDKHPEREEPATPGVIELAQARSVLESSGVSGFQRHVMWRLVSSDGTVLPLGLTKNKQEMETWVRVSPNDFETVLPKYTGDEGGGGGGGGPRRYHQPDSRPATAGKEKAKQRRVGKVRLLRVKDPRASDPEAKGNSAVQQEKPAEHQKHKLKFYNYPSPKETIKERSPLQTEHSVSFLAPREMPSNTGEADSNLNSGIQRSPVDDSYRAETDPRVEPLQQPSYAPVNSQVREPTTVPDPEYRNTGMQRNPSARSTSQGAQAPHQQPHTPKERTATTGASTNVFNPAAYSCAVSQANAFLRSRARCSRESNTGKGQGASKPAAAAQGISPKASDARTRDFYIPVVSEHSRSLTSVSSVSVSDRCLTFVKSRKEPASAPAQKTTNHPHIVDISSHPMSPAQCLQNAKVSSWKKQLDLLRSSSRMKAPLPTNSQATDSKAAGFNSSFVGHVFKPSCSRIVEEPSKLNEADRIGAMRRVHNFGRLNSGSHESLSSPSSSSDIALSSPNSPANNSSSSGSIHTSVRWKVKKITVIDPVSGHARPLKCSDTSIEPPLGYFNTQPSTEKNIRHKYLDKLNSKEETKLDNTYPLQRSALRNATRSNAFGQNVEEHIRGRITSQTVEKSQRDFDESCFRLRKALSPSGTNIRQSATTLPQTRPADFFRTGLRADSPSRLEGTRQGGGPALSSILRSIDAQSQAFHPFQTQSLLNVAEVTRDMTDPPRAPRTQRFLSNAAGPNAGHQVQASSGEAAS